MRNNNLPNLQTSDAFLTKNWAAKPDASINRAELEKQYKLHPERWQKAFDFLQNNDLKQLTVGRHDLMGEKGDELYANVDEYVTREEGITKYEAHKKYVDIQYLVYGNEKIGLARLAELADLVPYDVKRDIAFYKSKTDLYLKADHKHFFIFFPNDGHRPCVVDGEAIKVRKVVVKVRLD